MCSTDSPRPEGLPRDDAPPYRSGVDAAARGRRAECDGGRLLAGTHFAGRQEFAGTLTGDYRDFGGDSGRSFGAGRWRWYLMTDLTRRPPGYPHAAVWCDEDSLTYLRSSEPEVPACAS